MSLSDKLRGALLQIVDDISGRWSSSLKPPRKKNYHFPFLRPLRPDDGWSGSRRSPRSLPNGTPPPGRNWSSPPVREAQGRGETAGSYDTLPPIVSCAVKPAHRRRIGKVREKLYENSGDSGRNLNPAVDIPSPGTAHTTSAVVSRGIICENGSPAPSTRKRTP